MKNNEKEKLQSPAALDKNEIKDVSGGQLGFGKFKKYNYEVLYDGDDIETDSLVKAIEEDKDSKWLSQKGDYWTAKVKKGNEEFTVFVDPNE